MLSQKIMKRDYRTLLVSTFLISGIGGTLYPILALYLKHLTESNLYVGMILAVPFFIQTAACFVWGLISDYIGRRKEVIIASGAIGAGLFFTFPFAEAKLLIILRSAQIFFTSSNMLLTAVVTEYFPKEKGKFIGDLNVAAGIGATIGGAIIGLFIPQRGLEFSSVEMTNFFMVSAVVMLVAVLMLLPIYEVQKIPVRNKANNLLKFGERKLIGIVASITFFAMTGGFIIFAIFPVYLEEQLLSDIDENKITFLVGMFAASSSITGIIASGFAGRICDSFGRKKVLVAAVMSYLVIWFFISLTANIFIVAFLWTLPIFSLFYVSVNAMVSDLTSKEERGRGLGLLNSAFGLGAGLGSLLGGFLASFLSYQATFRMSVVFVIVSLIISYFAVETLTFSRTNK